MAEHLDIDKALRGWDYDSDEIAVRLVTADDGREVLQMRVELGVLQLEVDHRPDGHRPDGFETYFDHLLNEAVHEGDTFKLDETQCEEVEREFIQFYHRRLCWLALKEFTLAMRDADHTLALMDFVRGHSPSEDWAMSHEQYRPFILFHRTQAAALSKMDHDDPSEAIAELNRGIESIRAVYNSWDADDRTEDDDMLARLKDLREKIRDEYQVGLTLKEQLADAVAQEQYERAARLRDEIARKSAQPGAASD
jgi:hypothetical protein